MNKYEKLIEYIINEQDDKARELFHQIVVEKSREIYENLVDEEEVEENFAPVADLVDEVDAEDEMGMAEAGDDEMDIEMPADMGGDGDMGGMDDMGGEPGMDDDMGGEGELEDRVMDLEAALDELKAEFDALMADEEGEPEHSDGESDPDFGGDDAGEEPKEESMDPNMVREYVDKVATPSNTEGQPVGTGASDKHTTQTRSPNINKANNMGGSSSNIVRGGTEQAADGKPTPKPSNEYTKGQGQVPVSKKNVNVPGGKASNFYSKKETSWEAQKGAEGQTTAGKTPVNPKALQGGKIR